MTLPYFVGRTPAEVPLLARQIGYRKLDSVYEDDGMQRVFSYMSSHDSDWFQATSAFSIVMTLSGSPSVISCAMRLE